MLVNCLECEIEFKTIPAKVKTGKGKYCSRVCYLKAHSDGVRETVTCKGCGKQFVSMKWRKSSCCSLACNSKWRFKQEQEKGIIHRQQRVCKQCSKEFWVFSHRVKDNRGIYCDRKCKAQWQSENLIGKKAKFWKGGITPLYRRIRTISKYYKWRSAILERDNHQCVECGEKLNLEVDHVVGFATIIEKYNITTSSQATQCEELWDIANGRTLCEKCHGKTANYGKMLSSKKSIQK